MSMFEKLVKEEMHFCCLYAFFRKYKSSGQIADRLGVSRRTVTIYKQKNSQGEFKCEHCPGCLKGKLF